MVAIEKDQTAYWEPSDTWKPLLSGGCAAGCEENGPLTQKNLKHNPSQVDVLVARRMARSRWWEMWADRATEPKPPISQYWRQLRRLRSANFFTPWGVSASRNSFVMPVLKFVFCKNTYLDLIVFGPPWAQKMAGRAFDFWKTLWLFDIIGQLRLKQLLVKRIFLVVVAVVVLVGRG